eukprot:TRINITY_DN15829_c0_g1_i1.p1 TRINITY_DN15829_c0_g1~~TRINITY_DN15829_c0_g1_i1.p1  ORF type:complete len:493 (-),score=122.42 TRINITY_DN15829_c0_g1_i1:119-1597(-)
MKRNFWEMDGGKGASPPLGMAVKMLVSPKEAGTLIGRGGTTQKQITESTGVKLHLSGPQELYPGTQLQELCFKGDSADIVASGVLQAFMKLSEGTGKVFGGEWEVEEGGCRAHFIVPTVAARNIIGKGGESIKALRQASGMKVHVEEVVLGSGDLAEQVVSLAGPLQSIELALPMILEKVQELATQPWFASWAYNVMAAGGGAAPKGKGSDKGKGKSFDGGYGGADSAYGGGKGDGYNWSAGKGGKSYDGGATAGKGYDSGYDAGKGKGYDSGKGYDGGCGGYDWGTGKGYDSKGMGKGYDQGYDAVGKGYDKGYNGGAGKGYDGGMGKGFDKGKSKGYDKGKGGWSDGAQQSAAKGKGKDDYASHGTGAAATQENIDMLSTAVSAMPPSLTNSQDRSHVAQFNCPAGYVSALIGKAGMGTKQIAMSTDTKVMVRDIDGNAAEKAVVIKGNAINVASAYLHVVSRLSNVMEQMGPLPENSGSDDPLASLLGL